MFRTAGLQGELTTRLSQDRFKLLDLLVGEFRVVNGFIVVYLVNHSHGVSLGGKAAAEFLPAARSLPEQLGQGRVCILENFAPLAAAGNVE